MLTSGAWPESIAAFAASPCSFVISPAATAASTCFFSALLSASESALGATPSWLAASVTIAALRWLGVPSWVAAIAAPPPATARAAIPPATIFLRLAFIGVLLLGSLGGSPTRSAAGAEGRGVVRARAEPEGGGVRLARADVGDDDRLARLLRADRGRDVARAADRDAADLRDH